MESLYKLPVIRSSEDVRSIRDFHDKIEMNLQSLEAIEVEPESYGYLLVPMIKDKIPNELNTLRELILAGTYFPGFHFSEISRKKWELIFADFRGFILNENFAGTYFRG